MRILMVLDHEFPPDIRVENEIEALEKSGHEIHITCFTMKSSPREENFGKAYIHRKPISNFIHKTSVGALRFPFYFNFWRSFLNQLTQKYTFDAIHIHDLPLAKVGYEFAKKLGIKLTIDLHENWPALLEISTHTKSLLGRILSNTKQWKSYEYRYCNLADNIIVVVDEAKARLTNLGIDSNKISVVSNTLNTAHFDLTDEKPDKGFITLLYAGGINKHRGLQYVIQGLKYLKDLQTPVRLQILGTGSYVDYLVDLATTEGVNGMVDFTGWKPYKEMIKYVGKADICLIPHVKNDHTDSTIPHKLFQYMYADKPVVVSNCSPIARIVKDTNSGLIYDYNNPIEFANCIRKLHDNKELLKQFSESGKQKVIADYTWDKDSYVLNQIYSG